MTTHSHIVNRVAKTATDLSRGGWPSEVLRDARMEVRLCKIDVNGTPIKATQDK
jgi:hypothetical protein